MNFDTFFNIVFWSVFAIICVIMTALGYFLPWIAPTIVLVILGALATVTQFDKEDVTEGIVAFLVSPLIGTLFINPGLSLGQYEWLLGIWTASFVLGCLSAYFLQRGRKPKANSPDLIATIH